MRVYGDATSGNCLKVKYTADLLGIPYTWEGIDLEAGDTRRDWFLALNPVGQVPVVAWDGGRVLAQSNAIIAYLAEGSPLLPDDPFRRAKVFEWMFWEQYSHEPAIAVARSERRRGQTPSEGRMAQGHAALRRMEQALTNSDWLVPPGLTVADVALVAYTRLAPEGGFDLAAYPAVAAWIARVSAALDIS